MSKWEYTNLSNICEIQIGEQRDKQNQQGYLFIDGNIPLIDGSAIRGNKLYILNSNRYYNKKALKFCKLFPKETVCLICIGENCGDCSLLKLESCLSNSVFAFNCYENLSYPKFIKYCYDSNEIKSQIKSLSYCSSAQPALSIEKINFVKIPNPPYEVQRKIGEIISSYDILIDILDEKIQLLEEARDSIYKEWFIKLRFPNHEKFSLKNSLTKNWKYMKLKDISEITRGTKPAGYALNISGGGHQKTYPFFTCSVETQRSLTYSFDMSAILVSSRGIFTVKKYRGKFEASNNVYIFWDKNINLDNLIFNSIKKELKILDKISFGTAQNQLSIEILKNLKILMPDPETLAKFNTICENIQLQIENLQEIIEECEVTRKDLLNRIFSQKIKITFTLRN